jgi:hypothetical protein
MKMQIWRLVFGVALRLFCVWDLMFGVNDITKQRQTPNTKLKTKLPLHILHKKYI